MPTIAVPKAPTPVHTAYAVPKGMAFKLKEREAKLNIERVKKTTVGQKRVKFSDSFSDVVNPISQNPAKRRKIHAI